MFFSIGPASATHLSLTLTPSIIVQSPPTPPRLLSQPMKLTTIELKAFGEGGGQAQELSFRLRGKRTFER